MTTGKPEVLTVKGPTDTAARSCAAVDRLKLNWRSGERTMKTKNNSTIALCLTAILAFSPVASFAQATTTFSGEAVALRGNALGISLALSDTGPLASGGNLNTSLASVNVLGLASAHALKSTRSGSGTSSQSQSSVANLSLLGGLVAADVVKSTSSATCSNGQAAVTGSAELVGLVAAGQSVLVSNPNLVISLPGGISLIVNEQTSSPSGNTGSITVNALHVKGPSIDIVVAPPSPVSLAHDDSRIGARSQDRAAIPDNPTFSALLSRPCLRRGCRSGFRPGRSYLRVAPTCTPGLRTSSWESERSKASSKSQGHQLSPSQCPRETRPSPDEASWARVGGGPNI